MTGAGRPVTKLIPWSSAFPSPLKHIPCFSSLLPDKKLSQNISIDIFFPTFSSLNSWNFISNLNFESVVSVET